MTNTTANVNVAANQAAAEEANRIFNAKNIKGSIANLAKFGSGVFKKIVSGIQDMSSMDDNQVRATVSKTFNDAKEQVQSELDMLNMIPSFKDSFEAKTAEDALRNLMTAEKEILANKDVNIIKRLLKMFWTGIKCVAALIVKSAISAGKFVAVYGIRIVAVGLDFVVKIVKVTVKLFKTILTVVKAVKVAHNNNGETEEETVEEE